MTTLQKEIKKCAHCGCENEFDVVCSTSTFGPSDLDTRPAPLARYNILYGVQRCKKCNYCNENIEEKVDFDEAILTSKNYLKVINSNYPELAKNYMLASIIMESVMRYGDAGIFMLQACWVLDDEGLDAKKTRIVAAKLLEKEFVMDAYRLIAIDLYRRAEEFEAAKILINKSKFFIEDVYMKKVLKCEEVLVDIFDSECHDCSEIEKFIGESELEEKLKADTPEEVLRKLFDEESTESLYLYNDKGKVVAFEQIAIIPLEQNGKKEIYTLLHPTGIGEDDEALVFLLVGGKKLKEIKLITDDSIIDEVFDEYYRLVEESRK